MKARFVIGIIILVMIIISGIFIFKDKFTNLDDNNNVIKLVPPSPIISTSPSTPAITWINAGDPKLNENFKVTFTIISRGKAQDFNKGHFEIQLPEGIELVSGSLDVPLTYLEEGESKELPLIELKVIRDGNRSITYALKYFIWSRKIIEGGTAEKETIYGPLEELEIADTRQLYIETNNDDFWIGDQPYRNIQYPNSDSNVVIIEN